MPDWEEDSPELSDNLSQAIRMAQISASRKDLPSLDLVRDWHTKMMDGLEVPDKAWIGKFRGEKDLEKVEVRVGAQLGTSPTEVPFELGRFFKKLRAAFVLLDERLENGDIEGPGKLELVVPIAAWAHAEWVRIHPFANGNGRTARLWANWTFMRFGIPPQVLLRPRPAGDAYARAGEEAMKGNWQPTLRYFEAILFDRG